MLKLTKKADYGLMAMKHLAEQADQGACSAKDVAEAYGIPQEVMAKILQRLVKAGIDDRPVPYGNAELNALARHCTDQEDNAAKVERQVRKSAAAQLLASRIGERFEAIVTGASEKGTWVRILQPPVEGKVVRGFEGLDVGDRARVQLIHSDVEHGFIDFVRPRGAV